MKAASLRLKLAWSASRSPVLKAGRRLVDRTARISAAIWSLWPNIRTVARSDRLACLGSLRRGLASICSRAQSPRCRSWFIGLAATDAGMLQRIIRSIARSEEHTSELQSLMRHSYAVFCLTTNTTHTDTHITDIT